ncbi:MAG: hypothetical protein A2W00_09735 [Candidatus Eisenbacteria bacterium RBG_16_71_46]|nr:MAG: hypothetical protein A2W00_09735 [Candidatus Eisenbacteria bacterium RBG_16_71_46]
MIEATDRIELRLTIKGRLIRRWEFAQPVIVVGRDPDADVVVDNPGVALEQFRLVRTPSGNYRMVDLGPPGQTFVNDRVQRSCPVVENDIIRFSKFELSVSYRPDVHGAESAEQPLAATGTDDTAPLPATVRSAARRPGADRPAAATPRAHQPAATRRSSTPSGAPPADRSAPPPRPDQSLPPPRAGGHDEPPRPDQSLPPPAGENAPPPPPKRPEPILGLERFPDPSAYPPRRTDATVSETRTPRPPLGPPVPRGSAPAPPAGRWTRTPGSSPGVSSGPPVPIPGVESIRSTGTPRQGSGAPVPKWQPAPLRVPPRPGAPAASPAPPAPATPIPLRAGMSLHSPGGPAVVAPALPAATAPEEDEESAHWSVSHLIVALAALLLIAATFAALMGWLPPRPG